MFGAVESNAMFVERLKRSIIANENWEIEKKFTLKIGPRNTKFGLQI